MAGIAVLQELDLDHVADAGVEVVGEPGFEHDPVFGWHLGLAVAVEDAGKLDPVAPPLNGDRACARPVVEPGWG